jgi:hypothetical protein
MKLSGSCNLGPMFFLFFSSVLVIQQPGQTSQDVIEVRSSLVLVDVITQDSKNGLPVRDFRKEDFRIFDDRNEVPIASFDAGALYSTRPFVIWLAVICNERGKVGGSREFAGKESLFRPALDHLDKSDTVGVAHWCDDGQARLDLLPTDDRDIPLRVLAETIKPISFQVGGNSNLAGEDAYRRMIRLVIQDAHRRNPQPLPVIIFLDGDLTGQPRFELDKVVDDILETSGIVFGIKDDRSPTMHELGSEQGAISHYVAEQTGGQYFSAPPQGYAAALDMILMQLHFRYELGFIPLKVDGKRHELKVELTDIARGGHKGVRLRFRPEYIPLEEVPPWTHAM